MQPHIWYYNIIGTIQALDLEKVFSVNYSVRYYWVNRLSIVINILITMLNLFTQ